MRWLPSMAASSKRSTGAIGTIKLFVDGKQIGCGDLPVTIPLSLGLAAGVAIGSDLGAPVMPDYQPPSAAQFTSLIPGSLRMCRSGGFRASWVARGGAAVCCSAL
jgi:hypothetical protein